MCRLHFTHYNRGRTASTQKMIMVNKFQISAGGVAFRRQAGQIEVALISVGSGPRWQLPKGMVNPDETNEIAAQREVREEAGIDTELGALIDRVEYWYYASE